MLTIKEYSNLIGWQPWTKHVISSEICVKLNFLWLMNHKFNFTQISELMTFSYKVQKTCFWAIFAQWGLNLAVTHNYVWVPYIMLSSRRNLWANSEKTYGQTLFYRTLLAKAGGHKKKQNKKKRTKNNNNNPGQSWLRNNWY